MGPTSYEEVVAIAEAFQEVLKKRFPTMSTAEITTIAHRTSERALPALEEEIEHAQEREATKEVKKQDGTACPLLELPAEMRNHIWELAVVDYTKTDNGHTVHGAAKINGSLPCCGSVRINDEYPCIPVTCTKLSTRLSEEKTIYIRDRMTHPAMQPAITRVNRQIRSEALPIFYHENHFTIHFKLCCGEGDQARNYFSGRNWLRSLSEESWKAMQTIEIKTVFGPTWKLERELQKYVPRQGRRRGRPRNNQELRELKLGDERRKELMEKLLNWRSD